MKPLREDVFKVVVSMSVVIPFFPKSDLALDLITDAIRCFIANDEQLEWFGKAARISVKTWDDGGIPLLRALFCTKYPPDDGVPPIMEFPGMTATELEGRFRAMEISKSDRRFEEYRRLAVSGPPENREALGLPAPISTIAAWRDYEPAPREPGPVPCPWCKEGLARVKSSVSSRFVHPRTEVGRVTCKNLEPMPGDLDFDPPAVAEVQAE